MTAQFASIAAMIGMISHAALHCVDLQSSMRILNSKGETKMPKMYLCQENDGTWTVLNRAYDADFQVTFETENQAKEFITEFMFKFFTSRVY